MADLVERLQRGLYCPERGRYEPDGMCDEAADTITTLKAEVERLKRTVEPSEARQWIEGLGDILGELKDKEITTLRTTNERLTALLKEVDDWVRGLEPFADAGHEPVTVFKKVRAALTAAEGEKP